MLSPCVHVCKIEGSSCIGCARTLNEISTWKDLDESHQIHLMTHVLPLRQIIRGLDLNDLTVAGRRLHRGDKASVLAHFLALEPEARRSRFGYSPHEDNLKNWVNNLDWEHTVVWGISDMRCSLSKLPNEPWLAVGILSPEGRMVLNGAPSHRFEVGLSVLQSARGQGLGSRLIEGALDVAQRISPHGQMILYTQKDCTPIFRLVLKHGGRLQNHLEETVGLFEW